MTLVEAIFMEMLRATEPSGEALAEAKARRDAVFEAVLTYEGAYRVIKSGSIAHGTVSGFVSDADGSVVLSRKVYPAYGPDGQGVGPKELIESIAEDLRNLVQQIYPNVWVSTNHKHAIYFRFREELADGQNPTVDLVVALNRKEAPGLWIPHLPRNIWQASDPEAHTKLVKAKYNETRGVSARVVRLAKLYAKQWEPELLYSFHLTALMLESLRPGTTVGEGFTELLRHASLSIEKGNTRDPAGVSASLKIPKGREREKLVKKLGIAADRLERAASLETSGDDNFDAILDELNRVFWRSNMQAVLEAAAQKVKLDRAIKRVSSESPYASPVIDAPTVGVARPIINARAYVTIDQPQQIHSKLTLQWYNNRQAREWFEQGVKDSEYGVLSVRPQGRGTYSYLVSVPIPEYRTSAVIRVAIEAMAAHVYAPNVKNLRHINPDRSLCLWHPGDKESRKWRFDNGLLALLDLAKLHLYKELRFKETGEWPGEEVH